MTEITLGVLGFIALLLGGLLILDWLNQRHDRGVRQAPGSYETRYRDLESASVAKSEPIPFSR